MSTITKIIQIHPDVAELLAGQAAVIEQQRGELGRLQQQLLELGRKNIALAAEAERAELAEQQLVVADLRIAELQTALAMAKLPAESRDTVISMVKEAA